MPILAMLLSLLAALVGASLWAGITYVTGYQIGWMAIAVGAMIGAGARMGGGEGKTMALYCAGLAIVAMFAGEIMTVQIELNKFVGEVRETDLTREFYDEELLMAEEFVLNTTEETYRDFVHEYTNYSEASTPEGVTDEEVQLFLDYYAPELRTLNEEQPSFEAWREEKTTYLRAAIMEGESLSGFALGNIGFMGALFMLLGVGAAMRVVTEWSESDEAEG